jgi:hypothetical protein
MKLLGAESLGGANAQTPPEAGFARVIPWVSDLSDPGSRADARKHRLTVAFLLLLLARSESEHGDNHAIAFRKVKRAPSVADCEQDRQR